MSGALHQADAALASALSNHRPFGATPLPILTAIPPREWLYGEELAKRYVSSTGAPGGAGKSTYAVTTILSVSTGRSLFHTGVGSPPKSLRVHQRGKVWWYNLEDPQDELLRRIQAGLLHHKIAYDDVRDWIFVNTGREQPLIIAKADEKGSAAATPVVEDLVAELTKHDIKLLVVDPFVSCHELAENSNEDLNFVLRLWGQVADRADCAVWLIHHFRKGGVSGDGDAFRGGGSFIDACRAATSLATMTAEDAAKLGVQEEERWRYKRLDNAKQNMSPPADKARWFKLVSVDLDNGTSLYPEGDSVQTMEAWAPPSAFDGLDWALAEAILRDIDAGMDNGQLYTIGKKSDRWAGHIIAERAEKGEAQVKEILAGWNKASLFRTETYKSPLASRKGKDESGVKVNWQVISNLKQESPHDARCVGQKIAILSDFWVPNFIDGITSLGSNPDA